MAPVVVNPAAMPARPRFDRARALWALPPLLVLAAALRTCAVQADVPARADWAAATAHVRGALESGDGVTWVPPWAGEGRLYFHDLPAFRSGLGDDADLARHRRVWVLGAFGYDASDLSGAEAVEARLEFGPLTLEQVVPSGLAVVPGGDLRRTLDRAVVRRVGGAESEACDFWNGQGWHCDLDQSHDRTRACLGKPVATQLRECRRTRCNRAGRWVGRCGLNPFLHVSRDTRVIGDAPRNCIWMHPVKGRAVRLEWPKAPAGSTLDVRYGFADAAVADYFGNRREPRTQTATLRVLRGDAVLVEQAVEPKKGWFQVVAALPPEPAPLAFEITTDSTTDAHFCFDPTVRQPRADDGGAP